MAQAEWARSEEEVMLLVKLRAASCTLPQASSGDAKQDEARVRWTAGAAVYAHERQAECCTSVARPCNYSPIFSKKKKSAPGTPPHEMSAVRQAGARAMRRAS